MKAVEVLALVGGHVEEKLVGLKTKKRINPAISTL
jgi:hypothetical protein